MKFPSSRRPDQNPPQVNFLLCALLLFAAVPFREVPPSTALWAAPAPDAGAIRRIMWDGCGIVRSGDGLRAALCALEGCATAGAGEPNMREVGRLIARCALAREESRGAHFRSDFPQKSAAPARHTVITQNDGICFR
jgi:aspartate oxidase